MANQDYVLVMIEQFFRVLSAALERRKNNPQQFENYFDDIYQTYLKVNRAHLLNSELQKFITQLGDSNEAVVKKEILAELCYQELKLYKYPNQKEIASELLALYDDLDGITGTYSLTRIQRRKEIQELLMYL